MVNILVVATFLPFLFLFLTLCLKLFISFFIPTQNSTSISLSDIHQEKGQLLAAGQMETQS